jgi:serine/threonine protein phosphatase PrpC
MDDSGSETVTTAGATPSQVVRMLGGLLDDGHLAGVEQLPGLVADHAARAGVEQVVIYLADLREQVLRELTGRGLNAADGGGQWSVDGSLPGRVFRHSRSATSAGSRVGLLRYWVPILDGTQRLGVLGAEAVRGAEETLRYLAAVVALQLVSKSPFSDAHARLVRTRPMNVAAEMQWGLIPPRSFANEQVAIAAVMEPAYAVGGDSFDFAIAGDTTHLAVFDAMGHDSTAGLTANLAVATCRKERRQGAGLVSTSESIERSLIDHFGHWRYVTAILADLDTATGRLAWVNRGHHPPVLIRGSRWGATLECPPAHPMGIEASLPVRLCREQLQPGDRLLLYTDGVTEARNAEGSEFGLERFTDFIIRSNADGLPVPETLRRLMNAVLDYHDGQLRDDATVLFCEWRGPARNQRLAEEQPDQAS